MVWLSDSVSSSSSQTFEEGAQTWGFYGDASYDLTLFDDLRTCLSDNLNVDLYRVSTTGMSAGGLWSTFLSMERSDALATAFIMSGGTGVGMGFKALDHKMPIILAWGGPNDTYNTGGFTIYFEDTTLDLRVIFSMAATMSSSATMAADT